MRALTDRLNEIESNQRRHGRLATDNPQPDALEAAALRAVAEDAPLLVAALRHVLVVHRHELDCGNPSHTNPDAWCPECVDWCSVCGVTWPCATVRVVAEALEVES